jgi:hypothetical protein
MPWCRALPDRPLGKNDGVGVTGPRKRGTGGNSRPRIPLRWLKQYVGFEPSFGALLKDHETIGGIGDNNRPLEQRGIADTL